MITLLLGNQPIEWPRIVEAVAYVESGHWTGAVGAAGERGAWQFREMTWLEISVLRQRDGLTTAPFIRAHDPLTSWLYANYWLTRLHDRLHLALRRPPTVEQLYCAHNLGLRGFAQRGYRVSQVPAVTKRALARLREYLKHEPKHPQ